MNKTIARRVRNTGIAGSIIAASLLGPAFVAPAINASPAAQQAGISVPADGAEAANAPKCNRGGIPIKWGKCYGPRMGWAQGHSYYNGAGTKMTVWYSESRAYWSGVYIGIHRDGDWVSSPSYKGRPGF